MSVFQFRSHLWEWFLSHFNICSINKITKVEKEDTVLLSYMFFLCNRMPQIVSFRTLNALRCHSVSSKIKKHFSFSSLLYFGMFIPRVYLKKPGIPTLRFWSYKKKILVYKCAKICVSDVSCKFRNKRNICKWIKYPWTQRLILCII